ncbi:MAG: ATP synthase F1 subunit delta [Myxococcaceae bacterium]
MLRARALAVNVSVARRYARALIDIAAEMSLLDKVSTELSDFVKLLEGSAELSDVLVNPAYVKSQRLQVVDQLAASAKLSLPVQNLLKLLVERNRINTLPDIQRLYADLADARSGRVRGKVTTAVALPDETVKRLEAQLEKLTQRDVVLETKVDPSLIGGVSAQVGNMVIDGSVKSQLETLRRELRGQ